MTVTARVNPFAANLRRDTGCRRRVLRWFASPAVELGQLLELLDLECLEVDLFRGGQPNMRFQRAFGGQGSHAQNRERRQI
jgi:hypothetical protein